MNIRIDNLGMFCSLANNPEEIYKKMCAGADAFQPIWRFSVENCLQKNAGQISEAAEDILREKFPETDLAGALLLEAACQALAKDNTPASEVDPDLALVLSTNFALLEAHEWLWQEKMDTNEVSTESFELIENFLPEAATFLGCGGPVAQLSLSCASGLAGLVIARDWLLSGKAKRVLVASYDLLSEFSWWGLYNLRTITTDKMCPFDENRSGTLFSEGAAAVLLSLEDESSKEQGEALAYLRSAAVNNNAFHITAPLPEAEGSRKVMEEAIRLAGIDPDDIEHICAHATSTIANDKTEAAALKNIFGDKIGEKTVAAHKSQLGHLLGAAGLAEMIITIMAMNNGVIPPTINHQNMDPDCQGIDCIPNQARKKKFSCALINSAGIGGSNSAAIITKSSG